MGGQNKKQIMEEEVQGLFENEEMIDKFKRQKKGKELNRKQGKQKNLKGKEKEEQKTRKINKRKT